MGSVQTLSIDAKQRLVMQGRRQVPGGGITTCAEPSPDALVAQAAVFSASGKGPSGASTVSGNAAVGFQESAGSLAHRTQTIQILRDGYYRLCEAYMNGAITENNYVTVLSNIDVTIAVIAAIDGLGNAPSTPAVAIGTGSVIVNGGSADTGGSAAIGAAPGGVFSQPGTAGGTPDTSKNAAAIQAIVLEYIAYVERRNRRFGM
ncbi:hypothetical protein [Mesorhizobium sp. M0589]|uniref:hypothetical protein n=1 Tax=Mesorhizobium sp. M0589 TaxID=2956965 RepID=UPI00333D8173